MVGNSEVLVKRVNIANGGIIQLSYIRYLDDQVIYRMFLPDKHAVEIMYHDPGYNYFHKELKKLEVALKLLWNEYKDSSRTEYFIPMGYTKFCESYGGFKISNRLKSA